LIEVPVHLKDGMKEAERINEHTLKQGDVFILDGYHSYKIRGAACGNNNPYIFLSGVIIQI